MEFTGCIRDVYKNIYSGKMTMTFEVENIDALADEYDRIKDARLTVKVSPYRAKRSLDANSYFHVLLTKIAGAMNISNARCKNILLARYGQPQLLPDGNVMIYKSNAPVDYMMELEDIHTVAIKADGNATFYRVMRGSHEYNTEEMSRLIDGTVDEAKALGIETMTPDALAKMEEEWKARSV